MATNEKPDPLYVGMGVKTPVLPAANQDKSPRSNKSQSGDNSKPVDIYLRDGLPNPQQAE